MKEKIIKALRNPKIALLYFLGFKIFRAVPDSLYVKLKYRLIFGKKLDLKNPKTFNEKLQWLKLYDRNPLYTQLVDKYEVRKYVEKVLGSEYLVPLFGIYNSFEEIDFDALPNEFVLKPTHTSGDIFICRDKSKIDFEKLKKEVNRWLKREYYWLHREWPYKNIKPKIICEKYLFDKDGKPPKDYKIFCFNGEPKLIQVDIDRFGNHRQNFYDVNWNFKDIEIWCDNDKNMNIPKPDNFEEMLEISRKLSKPFKHVRVDLYNINGKIFFGELTFYHLSGFKKFRDQSLEIEMGNWLQLK